MTIFAIADLHLNHANILKFTGPDGKRTRPDFNTVEEMHGRMAANWNSVVAPGDTVYVCGDVVMGCHKDPELAFNIMYNFFAPLKGKKNLILGNHDNLRMSQYELVFKTVYSMRTRGEFDPKLVLTHMPIRLDADHDHRKRAVNIHGHIHEKRVMRTIPRPGSHLSSVSMTTEPDPQYFNVSVEQTNYFPISFDEILDRSRKALQNG